MLLKFYNEIRLRPRNRFCWSFFLILSFEFCWRRCCCRYRQCLLDAADGNAFIVLQYNSNGIPFQCYIYAQFWRAPIFHSEIISKYVKLNYYHLSNQKYYTLFNRIIAWNIIVCKLNCELNERKKRTTINWKRIELIRNGIGLWSNHEWDRKWEEER